VITWTEEQNALRSGLAPYLDVVSADHIEFDSRAEFPAENFATLAKTGILGLPIDERWGGLGQDLLTTMYVLEGLGEGCRDGGLCFSVSTHMVSTGIALQRFGSDALREQYLPRVCVGELIGAHAISEPDSGSDALAMRTSAKRDGDFFILNGSKTFISNGPIADVVVVYARTHPAGGPAGITAFLVERGTPGFTQGQPIGKMGLRTSPLCELFFDDCRVPAANIVGRVGGGYRALDYVMKREILCSFAITLGSMRHRLDRCLQYAGTRTQFGEPIGSFQSVANRIVDMEVGLRSARSALFDAAERLTAGENATTDIAVAKLLVSEANVASALSAVQIFGGNGYTTEYGLEKDLRDAVAGTIYSGTSEIQRNRIASMLGL
jgi:alkylation response protein AidB-like acyl-CoA dehydrogenase